MSIDDVRKEARKLASLCEQGIDPREVRDEKRREKEEQRQHSSDGITTYKVLSERHGEIVGHSKAQAKKTFLVLSSIWNKTQKLYVAEGYTHFPENPIPKTGITDEQFSWDFKQTVIPAYELGRFLATVERLRKETPHDQ